MGSGEHISREGQPHARGLLVEAAHTAIRAPGPLCTFHARLAARRGKQVALCATARKLTVLVWHLLTKGEDYRYGAPTITQRKLRALQRKAADSGPKIGLAGETKRKVLERRLLEEAERNYRNYVAERASRRRGAGAACASETALTVLIGASVTARSAIGPISLAMRWCLTVAVDVDEPGPADLEVPESGRQRGKPASAEHR